MPIEKAEVLEVLRDPRLHNINFTVGPIKINSDEYDRVSDYVASGAIGVVPWKQTYSIYDPPSDTIHTKNAAPPLDLQSRTNLLHECTHAVSDINKVSVTRLADEVAAYLAQIAYMMLLEPGLQQPPMGPPLNNFMVQGMKVVTRYKLGMPGGNGAVIADGDIQSLSQLVQRVPDYNHLSAKDMLAANGVAMSDKEAKTFWALRRDRVLQQLLDEKMAADVEKMLTAKVRGVAYENWVTSDSELLGLLESNSRGNEGQKRAAQQKLLHIFLTVTQASADQLHQRLSSARKGDPVSERFQATLSPTVKTALLSALRMAR